jgi:tetratricopeptide (TPR) repeat protein
MAGRADKLKSDALELCEAGKTEEALRAANQALSIFVKEGKTDSEAELLSKVVTEAYVVRGDGERALTAANQALSICQKSQDTAALGAAWYAVASARFAAGSDDAMEAANKALGFYQDAGNKSKQVSTFIKLATGSLFKEEPMAALGSAQEALTLAKSIGNGALIGEATLVLVEAHLANGTVADGLSVAETEYVGLSKGADKSGLVDTMSAVVLAMTVKNGPDEALVKVKSYVEQMRATGDKKAEAAMLHKLGTMCTSREEAKNSMLVALDLATKVGATKLETEIKTSLTDLYAAMGKVEKAPNRKEALGILAEVGKAFADEDGDKFEEEYKHLTNFWNALTQHDFDKVVNKVVAKDEAKYTNFLKQHGIMEQEVKKVSTGELQGVSMPVPILYVQFRMGGLGYGPRFRCCRPVGKTLDDPSDQRGHQSWGVVELQDCSDDWERELGYNSSMMDCCLHTANATGYANTPAQYR